MPKPISPAFIHQTIATLLKAKGPAHIFCFIAFSPDTGVSIGTNFVHNKDLKDFLEYARDEVDNCFSTGEPNA